MESRTFSDALTHRAGWSGARSFFQVTVVLLVAGCGSPRTSTAPELHDDFDRSVAVPEPARRVVSLAPAITELLFDIGAGDRLVGRTAWCTDPLEALDVANVGDGLNPNVEAIAALSPDLVILYTSASNLEPARRLERLGIRTFFLRTDGLDDVARGARLLGQLTGAERRADSLARIFEAELDSARAVTTTIAPPSVLILAWRQPPIVIGGGSFLSELVSLAGGINAFGNLRQPSGQVSIETIVARSPDLILLTGGDPDPSWARLPEWRTVNAVRSRRFVLVEGTEYSRPSFRALEAARTLAAKLREAAP